jgi:hypothetical protein
MGIGKDPPHLPTPISHLLWERELRSHGERNSFVDEHDGNIIPNGIEILPILTYQATVDRLCHWRPAAVGELPLAYTVVDLRQQGRFGQGERLFRLWTGKYLKQFFANSHGVLPTHACHCLPARSAAG